MNSGFKKLLRGVVAGVMGCVAWAEQSPSGVFVLQKGDIHLRIEQPCSSLDYSYILTTPFFELRGYDGIPDESVSKGIVSIDWQIPLSLESLPKFSFFSEKPTTVGILTGFAGASGGSTQTIALIDTESSCHVQVELTEMETPDWIIEKGAVIGWRKTCWHYLGCHALGLGMAPRLDKCILFDDQETAAIAMEKQTFLSRFEEIGFDEYDQQELLKPLVEIDREVGEKFLDYVYYGTRAGKYEAVSALLDKVGKELQEESFNFVSRCRQGSFR